MKYIFRFLVLMVSIFTCANLSIAQWNKISGAGIVGTINALAVSPNGTGGTNLFAGLTQGDRYGNNEGYVYLSTDNGTNWTSLYSVPAGLPSVALVHSFAVSGTNLFAGTTSGVFLSANNGTSWTAVNTGLTNSDVNALAISGTNLFAGTNGGGVFLSTNNGTNWTAVNAGMTKLDILSFAVSPNGTGGTNIFAGTDSGGVFLSTNNGTSWTASNSGLPAYTPVYSLAANGTDIFAGSVGVSVSTDGGTSWNNIDIGAGSVIVTALAVSPNGAGGTNIFAGTMGGGVFLSTDNGTNWTAVNTGLTDNRVLSLAVSPNGTPISLQGLMAAVCIFQPTMV